MTREMDAYIAEKCFGYKNISQINGDQWETDENDCMWRVPRYTETMNNAWPVFEWLLENHPWTHASVYLTKHERPTVYILSDFDDYTIASFSADTFPLAICKAAVAAVQEIERTKSNP
jgi:hypothetical protein